MCVKIFLSRCYLVAKIIHIQSICSHIRVLTHMFFTIQGHWPGKKRDSSECRVPRKSFHMSFRARLAKVHQPRPTYLYRVNMDNSNFTTSEFYKVSRASSRVRCLQAGKTTSAGPCSFLSSGTWIAWMSVLVVCSALLPEALAHCLSRDNECLSAESSTGSAWPYFVIY
jgi:hypothetical protein